MNDKDLYDFSINNLVDDKPIEPAKSTSFINHIKNQNNIKLLAGSTINYKKEQICLLMDFIKNLNLWDIYVKLVIPQHWL